MNRYLGIIILNNYSLYYLITKLKIKYKKYFYGL